MNSEEYNEYIQSKEWKDKEKELIEQAGGVCQICGSSERLGGHHKNYSCLGEETLADVDLLCWKCHTTIAHVYQPHKKKLPPPLRKQLEVFNKDSQWRNVLPTLPENMKEKLEFKGEPKKKGIRRKPRMKDYKKQVYYDKKERKFRRYSYLNWLKLMNKVLKNIGRRLGKR